MFRNRWLAVPLLALLACQQQAGQEEAAPGAEQAAQPAGPAPGTPEWKVQNALGAAPAEIAANAAVMDWPAMEGQEMTELRPGTNGWTCMPDVPNTPGNDPMCLDQTFLAWAAAWQGKTKPELKQVGFGYMLMGGTDASNTDPYATEPQPGEDWVEAGPHVMMVVPNPSALAGITTDPHNGGPWVMWQGTPYAHIMMPISGPM